jgi:hypothetical protein
LFPALFSGPASANFRSGLSDPAGGVGDPIVVKIAIAPESQHLFLDFGIPVIVFLNAREAMHNGLVKELANRDRAMLLSIGDQEFASLLHFGLRGAALYPAGGIKFRGRSSPRPPHESAGRSLYGRRVAARVWESGRANPLTGFDALF